MNKKNKTLYESRSEIIATLTFNDWKYGHSIIDRIRGKVTEKNKGLIMLDKLESYFGINDFDKNDFRKKMKEKEEKDFDDMIKQANERKLLFKTEPVKWTRDEKGRIISPFPLRKFNNQPPKKFSEEKI